MDKNSNVVGPLLEGEWSNIQHVPLKKNPGMQGTSKICMAFSHK